MNTKTLRSGLIVPDSPKQKQKSRPVLELQDDEQRSRMQAVLGELADIMELIRGSGCMTPDAMRREFHGALHRHIGETLLGSDYRGFEEKT